MKNIDSFLSEVQKAVWASPTEETIYKVFSWNPQDFWNPESGEILEFSGRDIERHLQNTSRCNLITGKFSANETLLIYAFYK